MRRNGQFVLTGFLKGVVILDLQYPASWDLAEREAMLRTFRILQKKKELLVKGFCLFVCFFPCNEDGLRMKLLSFLE